MINPNGTARSISIYNRSALKSICTSSSDDLREAKESLGLKLVYSLVEDQLEGKLDLVSDAGTTFKISLPQGHKLRTAIDPNDA